MESIAIKEAKQELSELRRLMSTKDKIADLENQLKTGEFKVPIKTRGIIKNAQLRDAQIELQQLRRKVRDHIHRLKKRTLREKFIDVITLPRTLLATADMSYALRQASFLSARRPVKAVKIFSKAFKTFFSQNKADAIDIAIREHPNQAIRDKAGLFLASMDNIRFTDREEMFVSNLGERIPVWGKIVRASDRNMVSGLNMMRAACFDSFLKSNPNATDVELKAWADYVNVASGRGNLGKFIGATEYLSTVLFAPRFSASRFQTPFKLMQYWKHKTVRKEIAKDMLAFVALGMTTLTLAGLAGADVGDDPESSDFGKIIIGNTRVDVWGGFQQPARLMLVPILKGLDKAGIRKMTSHIDIYDAASRFSTYKLSPSITIPVELLQGKTVVGEEVTAVQTLARNVVPLALQDTYERATGSENIAKTLILGTGAFMGLSMAEHKARGRRRAARR